MAFHETQLKPGLTGSMESTKGNETNPNRVNFNHHFTDSSIRTSPEWTKIKDYTMLKTAPLFCYSPKVKTIDSLFIHDYRSNIFEHRSLPSGRQK